MKLHIKNFDIKSFLYVICIMPGLIVSYLLVFLYSLFFNEEESTYMSYILFLANILTIIFWLYILYIIFL